MGQVLDATEQALRIGGFSALARGAEETGQDITKELEERGVQEQAREVINQMAVPATIDLDLPEVTSATPLPRTRPIGPTLLPNPQDQELAERLS